MKTGQIRTMFVFDHTFPHISTHLPFYFVNVNDIKIQININYQAFKFYLRMHVG